MSFILDALKKSEAERQRQAGPALLEMRVVRPQRRIPPWLLIVGAVLIVLNLGGMLWLFLRPSPPATGTAAVTRPPAAAAGAPAGTGGAASVAAGGSADGLPQLAPGERLIGPGGTSSSLNEVPRLAGDGAGAINAAGAAPAGAGTGAGAASDPDVNPADFVPAGPATTRTRTANLPSYGDVSNQVPAMRLDLHVFDAEPARRYAFINMKKVREGETTSDGSRVLEITRDGVVLDYRSTEFLLTSDSSAPAGSAARGGDSR